MIGPSKILIVEDEEHMGAQLRALLEGMGHSVIGVAPNCAAALELIWRERPDIAFVDTHLGSETCEAVLDECDQQDVPVIVTAPDLSGLPPFCGDRNSVGKPAQVATLDAAITRLSA